MCRESHDTAGLSESHDTAGLFESHDTAGLFESHDTAGLLESHDTVELLNQSCLKSHDTAGLLESHGTTRRPLESHGTAGLSENHDTVELLESYDTAGLLNLLSGKPCSLWALAHGAVLRGCRIIFKHASPRFLCERQYNHSYKCCSRNLSSKQVEISRRKTGMDTYSRRASVRLSNCCK